MRAHILERVEGTLNIEDADLAPGHPHDLSPARRDLFPPRDHMFGHKFLFGEAAGRRGDDTRTRRPSPLRVLVSSPPRLIGAAAPHKLSAHSRLARAAAALWEDLRSWRTDRPAPSLD